MKISNALQNSGSKKTHFVCYEEISLKINRKSFCNVERKVDGDSKEDSRDNNEGKR